MGGGKEGQVRLDLDQGQTFTNFQCQPSAISFTVTSIFNTKILLEAGRNVEGEN